MAGFKFRLQSYYDLKGKLEDQAKLEYGLRLAQLAKERMKRDALEEERANTLEQYRHAVQSHIDPGLFRMMGDYIERLKRAVALQEIEIQKAKVEAEEKRMALVEAMKQRKMLEKLHDRAKERHLVEVAKAEQGVVDEVISYRLAVKSNE